MRRHLFACLGVFCSHAAFGQSPAVLRPGALASCAPAISAAERQDRLPARLLDAIALVESGRPDPATGRTAPWPWTINAKGVDHFYGTKADAVAAVAELQGLGVRSIDVGCMQINLMHHPNAFASIDEAFDPIANATYGARFLGALYRQTGSWPRATAAYHSQTPGIGEDYESRVMAVWPLASQFHDSSSSLAGRRPPAPAVDYSKYTPAFAAQVKQMAEDRANLDARFGAGVTTAAATPIRHHGALPATAAPRDLTESVAELHNPHVLPE